MSFTTDTKRRGSAAGVARVISNILKRAGYQKADIKDGRCRSEGFRVGRLGGYSSTAEVDYHVPISDDLNRGAHRYSKILQMREDLFEAGYVSSHPTYIYIECTHP